MPAIAPNSKVDPPRGKKAIELEEWLNIMTRLYRILDKELSAIETRQNQAGKKGGEKVNPPLNDADTRRVLTVVRAVERVHIVNKDVVDEEQAKRREFAERDRESAKASLERKLGRIFGPDQA